MTDTETWRPLVTALGWALVHFIWQGTFVAILLAGVLQVLRGRSTNARYAAACAALLLMSIAPLITMAIVMSSEPGKMIYKLSPVSVTQSEPQPVAVETEPALAPAQTADVKAAPLAWSSIWSLRLSSLLPWIILLWLLGVIFFALRLFCGWLYTERLKFQGTRPPEEKWEQALRRLRRQLGVTCPVRLLESAMVKVPMVIGWLRPVILLPASAMIGLTPQQLEAIIAHELAHIRRHDYLINLLQAVVETLLFYHPAVWWISRQIRQEREHCCDDLAVAVCGDSLTYARALLEMEQLRAAGQRLAVAANGGLLMNRIQRLVGAQPKHVNRFGGLFASVIALSTLTTAAVGAQILLQSSSRADREVVSVRERESMKVDTATETPGESKGGDASQKTDSAQGDSAAEALLPTLQSASWDVRKAAVERLAQIRGGRAAELLIAALKDEHTQVREQAVIGLGIRQDERLAEPLITALTDQDWQVREQAAIALGRINDERAVESLLKALLDNEWAVREQAARSLGTAGQERAVEPLINALQDEHEQVREAAAKSLGIIGDRRALEPLSQALQDADEQVRKKAVEALDLLKQSGNESSMGALRKAMRKESGIAPDRRVNQQRAGDDLGRLYDEQTEDRLKERVIIALGGLGNEQARAKLNEITRSEKQYFLRERAMDELARRLSAGELSRLYDEQTEDRLKERVIIALARLDNEPARTKLNEIVRSEKRFYLRERALNELAQGLSAGQAQPVVR